MNRAKALSQSRHWYHFRFLLACVSFFAGLGISQFAVAETASSHSFSFTKPVSDSELDVLRGGFRTPKGLEISFGIRKLSFIDGELQNEFNYTADSLTEQHGGTAYSDSLPNTPSSLLRDVSSQISLIQNNLDNQLIQSISIMDIRITNLLTLHSSLSTSRRIAESVRNF